MRRGPTLTAFLAVGGPPLACLLALLLFGEVAAGPALLSMVVIALAALVLALVWVRDVGRLASMLRDALQLHATPTQALAGPVFHSVPPSLASLQPLARDMERLSRSLGARTSLLGEVQRANEAIVERLPDPLLVLDGQRAILRANAAARIAYGADIAAVLRNPLLRAAIDQAYLRREATGVDLSLPVPTPREVQARVIHLDPPLSDGGRAIVLLSDRTRERLVERMRADFVANASHELRTPLASLIGFIDTLRGPAADDPAAQARFLGIMAEQAARMNRLIDDLLSLSRIELTEHQAPSARVDLAALATRIAAGFEPRLAPRRVQLDLAIAASLPDIAGDADQLSQVIGNLVENAIKYGREGGAVRLAVSAAEPGGRWPTSPGLLLSVTDDGPGIPRAHVPRLTERFYRVDQGRSRAAGGTGLGLAIVKHIVNRHRGRLVIESEEGKGACFSVWLPLAPAAPAAAPGQTALHPAEETP